MNHTCKILMTTLLFVLTISAHAYAGGTEFPPDNSSPELLRIKNLAGRWTTVTSMFGKKNQRLFTEYQVTSGGSAVLERIFPGTPYEMVSVYYDDDNGKLAMTHYCIMRNRSTLKLAQSTEDTMTLRLDKVSGVKSKETKNMGDLKINFKDKNHIAHTCGGQGRGSDKSEPMTMEYTRVR